MDVFATRRQTQLIPNYVERELPNAHFSTLAAAYQIVILHLDYIDRTSVVFQVVNWLLGYR